MLAVRLVIDTNVLASAALKPEDLERTIILLAITKPSRLYVTAAIMEEYADVLARRELDIRKGIRLQLLELIRSRCFLVALRRRIKLTSDPDNSIFIECADAARADYLITGSQRHFPRFWKCTKVITPREFIEVAAPHLRA